jgi:hypothetical protein
MLSRKVRSRSKLALEAILIRFARLRDDLKQAQTWAFLRRCFGGGEGDGDETRQGESLL